jgi:TRAP-type C4-dicarboxylate transport system substrate-binding protein
VAFLKEKGIIVEENPDRNAFAALVQPVYDAFVKQAGNDKYLKMVQSFVAGLK